jgi:hypothetical protein
VKMARVLIACEFSGVVRDAFLRRGHDAMSCDLLPTETPGPHYQGDVRDVLGDGFDLLIAHPPCTYLSRAGARWWGDPERERLAREALAFVRLLWEAPIPRVAVENPIGRLNRWWRYPDQTIEPWHFGDPYTKRTCLWLRGLPPLMATVLSARREAWLPSNTSGFRRGQRSQRGHAHTARDAARTFPGVANAMADQWGALVPLEALA